MVFKLCSFRIEKLLYTFSWIWIMVYVCDKWQLLIKCAHMRCAFNYMSVIIYISPFFVQELWFWQTELYETIFFVDVYFLDGYQVINYSFLTLVLKLIITSSYIGNLLTFNVPIYLIFMLELYLSYRFWQQYSYFKILFLYLFFHGIMFIQWIVYIFYKRIWKIIW